MVYIDQIWHTYACQHCRTTDVCNNLLMNEALLSISPVGRGHNYVSPYIRQNVKVAFKGHWSSALSCRTNNEPQHIGPAFDIYKQLGAYQPSYSFSLIISTIVVCCLKESLSSDEIKYKIRHIIWVKEKFIMARIDLLTLLMTENAKN